MKYYHWIGLFSITICTVLIGVDKSLGQKVETSIKKVLPIWIPIITGFLVPISMAINALLTKHLTSERIGFNPTKITFTSLGGQNVVILIIGIILWSNETLIF